MSLKQKLSSKSLSEKYKIAQLFKNGVKWAKIAKDLDIPSSTVYNVCKNVDRVIAEYKQGGNGGSMHTKPHSFDRVDRPLLEFFCLARDSKLPISGALLLEKARIYAADLGYPDPEKLVNHWNKWNEIVVKKLHGEAESVDQDAANDWQKNRLPQLLKEFTAENVFNCHEKRSFLPLFTRSHTCVQDRKMCRWKKVKRKTHCTHNCKHDWRKIPSTGNRQGQEPTLPQAPQNSTTRL